MVGKRNIDSRSLVLMFLTFPVIALGWIVRDIHRIVPQILFSIFYFLFGIKYVVLSDKYDTHTHLLWFEETSKLTFTEFFDKIVVRLSPQSLDPDVFQFIVEFLVSRIFPNNQFFLGVLAFIMCLFILKILNKLFEMFGSDIGWIAFIFIIFIIVLYPPFRVSSFRHNCASLLYAYSVLCYLDTKKIKYVIYVLATIFLHLGFVIPISLFLIYLFVGNRPWIYILLVFIGIQFSSILPEIMISSAVYASGNYKTKVKAYSHENFIESKQAIVKEGRTIVAYFMTWTNWFLLLSSACWFLFIRVKSPLIVGLFSISLLLFAFISFSSVIISISSRFSLLYQLLVCIYFVVLFAQNKLKRSFIFEMITIVFLVLNFVVITRQGFEFMNVTLLYPLLPLQLISQELAVVDIVQWFKGV